MLIQYRADVNYKGSDGLTALHAAAENGRVEVVKLLLAAGADQRIRFGARRFTAADLAWSANHPEVVTLLEVDGRR